MPISGAFVEVLENFSNFLMTWDFPPGLGEMFAASLSGLGSGLVDIESKFESSFKLLTVPLWNVMLSLGIITYLTPVASVKFSSKFAYMLVSLVGHSEPASPPHSVDYDMW